MTLRLLIPSALVAFFRRPVVEAIAPSEAPAPEWNRELQLLRGLTETHRCTADNIVFYDFARREKHR